ncbi:MAG: hypothetical protein LC642_01050, partial [Verrucomicrobiaceae bacterium]|nr:hypothetical protein [Verrucomicrobiaceae bacterium]
MTESWTRGRVAVALFASLLSVHTLYYNSVLLFAVCMGAVAVMLRSRRFGHAVILLGLGAVCALSMLPYRAVIQRVQSTAFMWKVDFTVAELCGNLAQTLGSHSTQALVLSLGLFAVTVVGGICMLWRKPDNEDGSADRNRLLFALVALFVGIAGYAAFLLQLSYRTRPWYYVVVIAFIAICLEMILASAPRKRLLLLARSAFTLLFVGTAAYPTFNTLAFRQTNVDHVADTIERFAQPGDLVVLNTWNYGISFRRYFDAPIPYRPVPPIEDLRSHRVDLVKVQMMSASPIAPVLQDIETTLRSGHTVWLIGRLDLVEPGVAPLQVPPGQDGPAGWEGGDFYHAWSEQIAHLFQSHGAEITRLMIPMSQPVMHHENLRLTAVRGWQDLT